MEFRVANNPYVNEKFCHLLYVYHIHYHKMPTALDICLKMIRQTHGRYMYQWLLAFGTAIFRGTIPLNHKSWGEMAVEVCCHHSLLL